ncbi:MAG: tetratricopeptide repeat protein [Acidobacteria bacterium]|nr:tetratricopeptide repeat protein [Acidobacteriota bacterium]
MNLDACTFCAAPLWHLTAEQIRAVLATVEPPLPPANDDSRAAALALDQGNLLIRESRFREATLAFEKAITIDPRCYWAWMGKGAAWLLNGDFREGTSCLDRAIAIAPPSSKLRDARTQLVTLKEESKKAILAGTHAAQARVPAPTGPELIRELEADCNRLITEDHVDMALPLLQKILEIEPHHAYAWTQKTAILQQLNRWDDALTAADQAVAIDPRNAQFWFLKGNALNALCPQPPSVRGSGDWLRLEESVRCYERCAELSPGFCLAWFHKALPEEKLGRHHDAMQSYERFLSLNPGPDLAPQIEHARNRTASREVLAVPPAAEEGAAAESWFERLADGGPDDFLAFSDMVLKLKPDEASSWVSKGLALEEVGRHAEAMTHYEKAIEMDGSQSDAWMRKGRIHQRAGAHAEALECFRSAVAVDPDAEETWYHKARAEEALGLKTDALGSYKKFLDVTPPHVHEADVRDAEQRIEDLSLETIIEGGSAVPEEVPAGVPAALPESVQSVKGGLGLYKKGDMAGALACFDRAIEIDATNADAWTNRGICLNALGRRSDGLRSLRKAIEINPRHVAALNNLGDALGEAGHRDEALRCYDTALHLSPSDPVLLGNRGTTLIHLNRLEEAVACFDQALEIDPKDTFLLANKGASLGRLGRHEQALECNDRVIHLDPRDSSAWYNRGCSLGKLKRYEEAIVAYDESLKLKPLSKAAINNKAEALVKLRHFAEALRAYDALLSLAPTFLCGWSGKAEALSGLGRNAEALECANHALQVDDMNPGAWYAKAAAAEGMGHTEEARAAFARFLALTKAEDEDERTKAAHARERLGQIAGEPVVPIVDVNAMIENGKRLLEGGELERALECFRQATQIDPNDGGGWAGMAVVLQDLGRHSEAVACHDRVIALNPEWAGARHQKADCLESLGRLDEAVECYSRAIEIDPEFVDAVSDKGHCLNRLNRPEDALECFTEAVHIKPDFHVAWFNKAGQEQKLGRTAEAHLSYQRFLAIVPPGNEHLVRHAQDAIKRFERPGPPPLPGAPLRELFEEAQALDKAGKRQEALAAYERGIACYDEVLKKDPRNTEAWNNKGCALKEIGKLANAITCFDKAMEVDPQSGAAWYNKAQTLRMMDRMEEAMHCYNRGAQLGHSGCIDSRALACFELGRFDGALRFSDEILARRPADGTMLWNKGRSLMHLGYPEKAIPLLIQATDIETTNDNVWIDRGICHERQGQLDEAAGCYERASTINPYSGRLWYNLGLLEERRGNAEAARTFITRAVEAFKMEYARSKPTPVAAAEIERALAKARQFDQGPGTGARD